MESIIPVGEVIPALNDILKAELSGVVRYTHYSFVITGPNPVSYTHLTLPTIYSV